MIEFDPGPYPLERLTLLQNLDEIEALESDANRHLNAFNRYSRAIGFIQRTAQRIPVYGVGIYVLAGVEHMATNLLNRRLEAFSEAFCFEERTANAMRSQKVDPLIYETSEFLASPCDPQARSTLPFELTDDLIEEPLTEERLAIAEDIEMQIVVLTLLSFAQEYRDCANGTADEKVLEIAPKYASSRVVPKIVKRCVANWHERKAQKLLNSASLMSIRAAMDGEPPFIDGGDWLTEYGSD